MTVLGKTRRQALTEFRETEILAAARKVFGERGFATATVDMIAAEAGVAKGTLYLYYDSKEEIFWAALVSRLRESLDATRQAIAGTQGAEARIRAALRVRFDMFRSDEAFVRMYVTEFGHLCRAKDRPSHALYVEGAQVLAAVLREGVAAGELRPLPPMETALALMEMVKGVFLMQFSGVPGLSDEAAFDGATFVFDLFWKGVRVENKDGRHE
ncbi:MAG: TetR/AcrR family transcriptional regulator [Terriglobales bacterium]